MVIGSQILRLILDLFRFYGYRIFLTRQVATIEVDTGNWDRKICQNICHATDLFLRADAEN